MGAAESTPRKLTIPNENQFIRITDSLAERLLASQEKQEKKSKDPFTVKNVNLECPPPEVTEALKKVSDYENIPPDRLKKYSGDALINYYYGPSVTSLRVLQAKEKELQETEEYWTKRIQNLELHHNALERIKEDEYAKAVEEINNQVPRPPPDTPFPCMGQKDKVIECYKANPNQPLLCAVAVTEFADCVQNKRIESLSGRDGKGSGSGKGGAGNQAQEKTNGTAVTGVGDK